MVEKITAISLVALALLATMLIVGRAVKLSEQADCFKWQRYAEQYPRFTLAKWQDMQCRHYHIIIKTK